MAVWRLATGGVDMAAGAAIDRDRGPKKFILLAAPAVEYQLITDGCHAAGDRHAIRQCGTQADANQVAGLALKFGRRQDAQYRAAEVQITADAAIEIKLPGQQIHITCDAAVDFAAGCRAD